MRNNSREIEFQLVQEEIEQIDELIKKGEHSLNWNSEGTIHIYTYKYIGIKTNFIYSKINYNIEMDNTFITIFNIRS